jgi:hypothetical protein
MFISRAEFAVADLEGVGGIFAPNVSKIQDFIPKMIEIFGYFGDAPSSF